MKITKKMREEAAWILSAFAADFTPPMGAGGMLEAAASSLGTTAEALRLASRVYFDDGLPFPINWGISDYCANAEALLRTGFVPEGWE